MCNEADGVRVGHEPYIASRGGGKGGMAGCERQVVGIAHLWPEAEYPRDFEHTNKHNSGCS